MSNQSKATDKLTTMNIKTTKFTWPSFIVLILSSIAIDYYIRSSSNNFYASGLSETIWFTIHACAFIILSVSILSSSKNGFKSLILKLMLNIIPATMLYLISIYAYILGFGIDSL